MIDVLSSFVTRRCGGYVTCGRVIAAACCAYVCACSASGDSDGFGSGNGGGTDGGGGALIDADVTGDGEMDPDSSCAATTLQAERIPLDMYFMVDTSGSMDGPKLELLQSGLTSFLAEGQSEDLGVSGQRFPIGGLNETCDASAYATPAVPWAILPDPGLAGWIDGLSAEGYTPSVPALQGAVDACKARMAAEAGRKCAVVFVSDGEPE
ncbi:MAG: hypothetical protein ACOC1F_13365, partial [Myxococcota bacterium]